MSLFGVDVSKYQPASAMDGYTFAILNIEDPTFADKARHAHNSGLVWDIYKWCYPGQNGGALLDRAKSIVDASFPGGRYPAFWLDYEEGGVTPNQVHEWFARADTLSVQAGWYCYLYLLNAQGNAAPDRPLWLAYYPGANDGTYNPAMSDVARQRGAKIHQYSSGGALDRNVILDEAWWASWSGDDEVTPEQMAQIGQWLQDMRDSILNNLVGKNRKVGDPGNGYVADWEWDTRVAIDKRLEAIEKKLGI